MGEVVEGINLEQKLDDEEISPLIDVINAGHNDVREQEQQMLAVEVQLRTSLAILQGLDQVQRSKDNV